MDKEPTIQDCKELDYCREEMDVVCPFHGQEALWNKVGYYAPPKCKTCRDTGFMRTKSKKFPIEKCVFCVKPIAENNGDKT